MYYKYCPDCGYQAGHFCEPGGSDYDSTKSAPVDRVVYSTIHHKKIYYMKECPFCGGRNCGSTLIDDYSMDTKVFLRSVIHYHINSPAKILKEENLDIS